MESNHMEPDDTAARSGHTNPDWDDRTLDMPHVWRFFLRSLPWIVVPTLGLQFVVWGPPGIGDGFLVGGVWTGVGLYLVSVVLHEGLHVATMLGFGAPLRSIRAGARLRDGVVYVHMNHDMRVDRYRVVLLMPALVLGLVPAVGALVAGSWPWMIYAFVMLISAAGDFAVIGRLRDLPAGTMVLDHPTAVGCRVRPPDQDVG